LLDSSTCVHIYVFSTSKLRKLEWSGKKVKAKGGDHLERRWCASCK
jgi:hypothetical protein